MDRGTSLTDCFVCRGEELADGQRGYLRCPRCGHQIRRNDPIRQSAMVNEVLSRERVERQDLKDRFQIAVALAASQGRRRIIDVGAGSGRFLHHIRRRFEQHLGIEITPECSAFAQSELGLKIASRLAPEDVAQADIVTFWHSLEHIPPSELDSILSLLQSSMHTGSRVVVSVPNGETGFKERSVYYDIENHIHQFSPKSLDTLMARYGFRPVSAQTGLGYSWLGRSLSLVNLVSRKHNWLYLELRRREGSRSPSRRVLLLLGLAATALASIPAVPGYLHDLLRPRHGIVLTFIYAKEASGR